MIIKKAFGLATIATSTSEEIRLSATRGVMLVRYKIFQTTQHLQRDEARDNEMADLKSHRCLSPACSDKEA